MFPMKKCVVLISGGLDSRLAVKIMQEKGFSVLAVYFKLPFAKDAEKEIKKFCKKEKVKLKIFDCTTGKLLQEYLKVLKNPKFGTGAGINPCIDCRIFMFSNVKKFADAEKVKLIATGEVEGQRPMSQTKNSLDLIEKKSGLKNRILRPLSDENFPYKIKGRRRDRQIALAKKFKIKYPDPAGGCLLCEKELKKRFEFLFERGLNEDEIKFVNIGRHFVIDGCWVVLGKDEKENKIIESFGKNLIIPDFIGPSAIILDKSNKNVLAPKGVPPVKGDLNTVGKKVNRLIKSYSKKGSLKERKKFERWKL